MDQTGSDGPRVELTCEVLQGLMSQLMGVCEMLPQNELLKDQQLQIMYISRMDTLRDLPKDVILEHLVSILDSLTSEDKLFDDVRGIPDHEIVNHLIGISMTLLSISENLPEMEPTNGKLKSKLSLLMEISRIIEPVNEIQENQELVIQVFDELMAELKNVYTIEWKMVVQGKKESDVSNTSRILKGEILDTLVGKLQDKLSRIMGINSVKGKDKGQILDLFIWNNPRLTGSFSEHVRYGFDEWKTE